MSVRRPKGLPEIAEYIPADEKILGKYDLGNQVFITTKDRLFVFKKFPKSFKIVRFNEVSGIEHYTKVEWNQLLNSIILMTVSVYSYWFNQSNDLISAIRNLLLRHIPEMEGFNIAGSIVYFVILMTAIYGVQHFLRFLYSLRGYLKISREGHDPITVHTNLTPIVRGLLKDIYRHMKQVEKEREKPIYIATGHQSSPHLSEENVSAVIQDEFNDVDDRSVVVVSSKSKEHMFAVSTLLDILINERGMGGVYISLTRPYEYVREALDKANIKSSDIYFIDCISQMAGKVPDKTDKNIIFVENPSSLEEVSMYLDRMLSRVESGKKFLLLDSLSSLLIYNTEKSVKEFAHFIINKIRIESITGVILSIEKKEADELLESLAPMCDKEIRI